MLGARGCRRAQIDALELVELATQSLSLIAECQQHFSGGGLGRRSIVRGQALQQGVGSVLVVQGTGGEKLNDRQPKQRMGILRAICASAQNLPIEVGGLKVVALREREIGPFERGGLRSFWGRFGLRLRRWSRRLRCLLWDGLGRPCFDRLRRAEVTATDGAQRGSE